MTNQNPAVIDLARPKPAHPVSRGTGLPGTGTRLAGWWNPSGHHSFHRGSPRRMDDGAGGGPVSHNAAHGWRAIWLCRRNERPEALSSSAGCASGHHQQGGRRRPHRPQWQRRPRVMRFWECGPANWRRSRVHDRVFLDDQYVDDIYAARRRNAFVVAVNCGDPAATCFCGSMKTGPHAEQGFDLLLTELCRRSRTRLPDPGRQRQRKPVAGGIASPAGRSRRSGSGAPNGGAGGGFDAPYAQAARSCAKSLYRKFDDPHWDEVAARCLTCANCTMVCPTCFLRHRGRHQFGRRHHRGTLAPLGFLFHT